MKSKYLCKIVSTLIIPISLISIVSCNENEIFKFYHVPKEKEDASTEYNSMWNQSIKNSSKDESIKLFFTRDASLAYQ